jgi:NCS1 family nucleobase:cation symporter-1
MDGTPQDHPAEIIKSLEDVADRKAQTMGLAVEQDPYFLAAFRSVLLSERDEVDAEYVQSTMAARTLTTTRFTLSFSRTNSRRTQTTHCRERLMRSAGGGVLVWPHGPALVRLYFRHVHPALPVVSKCRFLPQYHTVREKLPASLRGAIYALACIFWRRDETLPTPCPFEQYQLASHAHASLRRELEAPNLYKLQASLLLMRILSRDIDSVETPSVWILASQETACAQIFGLHLDPGKWTIPAWEKKARRKLWWAVYVTDCWSAVCHGESVSYSSGVIQHAAPRSRRSPARRGCSRGIAVFGGFSRCGLSSRGQSAIPGDSPDCARDVRAILDCSW